MLNSIKDKLRERFPNIINYWTLRKYKQNEYNLVRKQMILNESEYPSYLKQYYEARTGHQLDLEKPERFTEKVQWRKLYDKDDVYSLLSDKYQVREWVANKIGSEYLVPILGCWNHFSNIDFSALPDQFVLKTNNGCHANIIVKDKKQFLRGKWAAGKKMEYWMTSPWYYYGLEFHYKEIKPLIIAEEYLQPAKGKTCLTDYKFHCFSGTPLMCEVIDDRTTTEVVDFYDMNWKHMPLKNPPFPQSRDTKPIPTHYEEMVQLAKILSQGFQYVRVDLYCADKVYFGEMTFTPASGLDKYDPDEWDYHMGELWDITTSQVNYSVVLGNRNNQ